jgi:hypothetical protein
VAWIFFKKKKLVRYGHDKIDYDYIKNQFKFFFKKIKKNRFGDIWIYIVEPISLILSLE